MKQKIAAFLCMFAFAIFFYAGCGKDFRLLPDSELSEKSTGNQNQDTGDAQEKERTEEDIAVELGSEVTELESGLSAVRHDGDYGFEEYLAQGGASSDEDVVEFLTGYLSEEAGVFSFGGIPFGCSTISVENEEGERLFGRNFDWNQCNAMIVTSVPESGYASISTVNTDFIQEVGFSRLPDKVQAVIATYAPLDGMNEKGLAVSVNMIQDSATISQSTDKPDLTTTTAVRLLLNRAATTEEAVALLGEYDLHASMGYMVHFAIADAEGRSVAVEYVNDEIVVIETPVVTNFYMAEGEKNGIGTRQSHTRYEILTGRLAQGGTMSADDVRDALSSVSKGNFGEFESTEWSAVFNQSTGEIRYYHRENYENGYIFQIERR